MLHNKGCIPVVSGGGGMLHFAGASTHHVNGPSSLPWSHSKWQEQYGTVSSAVANLGANLLLHPHSRSALGIPTSFFKKINKSLFQIVCCLSSPQKVSGGGSRCRGQDPQVGRGQHLQAPPPQECHCSSALHLLPRMALNGGGGEEATYTAQ